MLFRSEAAKNPYAIGMAQAKKEIGLGKAKVKGLPKSTIKRAHHIGDTIKANESRQQQLTNLLLEGVNFTEMIKKKNITLQEMLAELQADANEQNNVSDRWKADMASDSWLSKNIRPMTLIAILAGYFVFATASAFELNVKHSLISYIT